MDFLQKLIIICPLIFFAGLVDSIAGGGGLISLPAYYLAGLSPHAALSTNKFSSTCGTSLSVYKFMKNKKINLKVSFISVLFAFIGSMLGSQLASVLDEVYLRYTLVVALPIVAFIVLRTKDFGKEIKNINLSNIKLLVLSATTGLVIGSYDGFFGPGTGTFLILIYTSVFGFDLITASGSAKIVNLSSNIAALTVGILYGNVIFLIAIPAALSSIAGNYVGASLALKNGSKVIKPVFVGVLILLMVTIVFSLFK